MRSAKEYFAHDFLADDDVRQINIDLVDFIMSQFKPLNSVFEFGCGQAKNLELLRRRSRQQIRVLAGVDISKRAIDMGSKKKNADNINFALAEGDESFLEKIRSESYDVCFTCSVLDHIPGEKTVETICMELKRIATKGVVLCETLADRPQVYYYPHPFEEYAFSKMDYEYYSDPYTTGGDGAVYHFWKYDKAK